MHHGKISASTAQGLLALKKRIDGKVPPSKLDETLNLATWNIREEPDQVLNRKRK